MRRSRFLTVALLCGFAASACARVDVRFDGREDKRPIEETHHFFLFGLAGSPRVDAVEYCKSGLARIHEEITFLNGLFTVLTLGIYTPRSSTIYCRL